MIKTVNRSEINRQNALKNPHRLKTHGGGYDAIHQWLNTHYGKANMCTGNKCLRISQTFQWALIKGKKHKHNRNNYMMLCSSCHRIYDQKPEWHQKAQNTREAKGNHVAGWNRGKKMPKSMGEKIRLRQLGSKMSEETKKKMSESSKKAWEKRKCQ